MTNIAIIGCGSPRQGMECFSIGHSHASAWQGLKRDDLRLYAVDIKQENLDAFAQKFNLTPAQCFTSTEALYASLKPDVVGICTWPALHHPQVMQAVGMGVKAIICEKPVALDCQQMDEMAALCQKKNVHLAISHQRRYEPIFVQARQVVSQGALGDRLALEARVGGGWDVLSWTVHWFDMASFLLDDQPQRLLSGMDLQGQRRYGHAVESSSIVFVEYAKGHQGLFITGPDAPLKAPITIRGEKGELRIGAKALTMLWAEGEREIPIEASAAPSGFLSGYMGLFDDVLKVIQGRQPSTRCSAPQGLMGTRLAYAAQESARLRRMIDLPSFHTGFAPLEVLQRESPLAPLVGKAVLLADAHHLDKATGISGRDGLLEALKGNVAAEVHLVPAEERELTAADLADADLLVLYHTQQNATPSQQQVIEAHVRSGRPMLVVHCGIGAYANWPQFRQWIGRYWVWGSEASAVQPASGHPHIPCTLKPAPGKPEIDLPWAEGWIPQDEVYITLGQASEVDVLATMHAQKPDGMAIDEPAIWRSAVAPRVVVTLPGHRADIWSLPVLRQQLRASASCCLA